MPSSWLDWWRKRRRQSFWIKCFLVFSMCFFISIFMASQLLSDLSSSDVVDLVLRREASGQELFLVILIATSPKNVVQRSVIRKTWLKNISDDIRYYFVVGIKGLDAEELSSINAEWRQSKDLLLLPQIYDSYGNLTDKIVESFKWLASNVQFSFLFKGDDDTFARLDLLKNELKSHEAKRVYLGFFDGRARVKKSGQWAETKWVLCDRYLPHARGGGYVLSYDLVDYIAENADLLQRFNSEDVSVGAWLGPLNIRRIHDPRFDTEYISRGCSNRYIVTHKQDVEMMTLKQKNLDDGKPLCVKEIRNRTSYMYNWKADPSMCCIRNDTRVP